MDSIFLIDLKVLKEAYPELDWSSTAISKKSTDFWKVKENQKQFLEDFARRNSVMVPEDWINVRRKDFIRQGGLSILLHNGDTLYETLKSNFPDENWELLKVKRAKAMELYKAQQNFVMYINAIFSYNPNVRNFTAK